MEIFELAAALGNKLKEDERLIALEKAKAAYEADAKLKEYLMEYEIQQNVIQREAAKEDRDLNLIDEIQKRVDALYKQITEHPVFIELNRVQAEVNDLMNAVNQTIMKQITGESDGCTHNCATCSGGCH